MRDNRALDTLAALCGGQTEAPTQGESSSSASSSNSASSTGNNINNASETITSSHASGHPSNNAATSQAHRTLLQGHNQQLPQQSPLHNLTPQQIQQAFASLQNGAVNPLALQNLLVSAGVQQQPQHTSITDNNALAATMHQLAYYQYVQAQAKAAASQQTIPGGGNPALSSLVDHQALAVALANQAQRQKPYESQEAQGQHQQQQQQHQQQQHQVIPPAASATVNTPPASAPGNTKSMKPPPPPSASTPSTVSPAGINQKGSTHTTIAPMPGAGSNKIMPMGQTMVDNGVGSVAVLEDKKQQKRAANRRSAQLSRKRKKQFIEELKEENDELRRKEQILRSIPDLIVVFDSSGKLWFVSQSVSRFLDMTPEELEGTSFWDRLCEDSVRLLKAAFMDSLAAKTSDSETTPLGSGVWELRLVDKDGTYKVVTLNGVVHFSGEAPECVCCIRPRDEKTALDRPKERASASKPANRTVSSSSSRDSSKSARLEKSRVDSQSRPKANQSVIKREQEEYEESMGDDVPKAPAQGSENRNGREAVRISDGDSGSVVSESGSDGAVSSN